MEKHLFVQPEKCTGCRTCETVCAFIHTGEVNPLRSRVTVFSYEKEGLSAPMVCQQCTVAACQEVCPVGAITRSEDTTALLVNDAKCLRCKMCTIACPFGATTYDPAHDLIMKCDLCGGEPQCVAYCPSGALSYQDPMQATLDKRRVYANKFKAIYEEVL